jgi:uncharacterized membrane-anchored protein YitT (DUF2179 family)
MTELNIVSGGVTGISIVIEHFVGPVTIFENIPFLSSITVESLIIFLLTWGLWFLGLFCLGKDFAFKTLLSSILFPIFFAAFDGIPFLTEFAKDVAGTSVSQAEPETGRLLLCGIFAGVSVGGGCALTFLGGGSTGGVDIVAFILEKYLKIKTSISVFIIDGTIVLIGLFTIQNYTSSLCGIIAAFLCSLMVELIYNTSRSCYVVDIISDHWEEIQKYVHEALDRGSTIIPAIGGYKGEKRIILRIVFEKSQYIKIKQYIAEIDPNAFITYTLTNGVFGKGFTSEK